MAVPTTYAGSEATDVWGLTEESTRTTGVDARVLNLRARLDAPRALRDHGFEESQIPDATRAILPAVPPSNPAHVDAEVLEELLRSAWEGADPR